MSSRVVNTDELHLKGILDSCLLAKGINFYVFYISKRVSYWGFSPVFCSVACLTLPQDTWIIELSTSTLIASNM